MKTKRMTRRVAPLIVLATVFFAWSCDLFTDDVVPDETKTEIENSDFFTTPNSSTVIDLKSVVRSYSNVSVTITEQPEHGDLNRLSGAVFSYKPDKNFKGRDRFLIDVQSGGTSVLKDSISIFVGQDTTQFPCTLIAMYDSAVVPFSPFGGPRLVLIDALENDRICGIKREDIKIQIFSQPDFGQAGIELIGNKLAYRPNSGHYGHDAFIYKISNLNDTTQYALAMVSVWSLENTVCERQLEPDFVELTVKASPEYSFNVLDNDNLCVFNPNSDPFTIIQNGEHGTATITSFGVIKYTATEDSYLHGDSLRYQYCHNDECYTEGVRLWFTENQCTMIARGDTLDLPFSALSGSLNPLENDEFCEGRSEHGIIVGPKHGTATFDGNFLYYTPSNQTTPTDSVKYRVCDKNNSCSDAVVIILRP